MAKPSHTDRELLHLVSHFLREVAPERAHQPLELSLSLERDLGIGSLERLELCHRVEKKFLVQLPEAAVLSVNTLGELLTAIEKAEPPQHLSQGPQETLDETRVSPLDASTLTEVLFRYGEQEPDRPHIYLQDELGAEVPITYGELLRIATQVAFGLHTMGVRPGETVAIMLPTCKEFFYAFFGILCAGCIPIPIYPPFRPDRIEEYAKREVGILSNASVRVLITFGKAKALSKLLKPFVPSMLGVATVSDLLNYQGSIASLTGQSSDIALIQYTSGSTGAPKGVTLTHANLLANLLFAGKAIEVKPNDAFVSWLPLYHDMGLIGSWLGSCLFGIPITILSPITFIRQPERWLWTLHYHRGTISAGPNFAYELCVRKIDTRSLEGLDLSTWRIASNGAEAVNPNTIARFTEKFAPFGFQASTMKPMYGLAESCVAVCIPQHDKPPTIDRIDREAFATEQLATPAPAKAKDKHCIRFVGCGTPLPDHAVRVVDHEGNALSNRTIGEVQFRGPSRMQGYYNNPEATAKCFDGDWCDTGDYGYLVDSELFITGRKKDLIITGGRNIHPEEVEELVSTVEGMRRGCIVAFGLADSKRGTEKLIIVAETRVLDASEQKIMRANVNSLITSQLEVTPHDILLTPPHIIPKTSSGKLQRSTCKQRYSEGKLSKRHLPVWLQVSKLWLQSAWQKTKSAALVAARFVYTLYGAAYIGLTGLPLWVLSFLLPANACRRIMKAWAKSLFFCTGCRITTDGITAPTQASVFVANHCSYTDAVLLLACLPPDVLFIGKKELSKTPIFRRFMKALGYLTVDRSDYSQSSSDMDTLRQAIQQGQSVVIFPEGTFVYAEGLRPFKLGAFQLAVDCQAPIIPMAIQGTRQLLRAGSVLFSPQALQVKQLPAIAPTNSDWQEVLKLRTLARMAIAKHCGEYTNQQIKQEEDNDE